MTKQYLLIPGPTPLPEPVLQAQAAQMITHRGGEFPKMLGNCFEILKKLYLTENPVYLIPSSGTGAMEAAIVNFLSPGDKIISANIGDFGKRWVAQAQAFGIVVDEIKVEAGKAVDPAIIEQKLKADPTIKAVFFQHNETSTGVLNDVEKIAKIVAQTPAISVMDGISGMLTAPVKTDEWGLDVVLSGSQKAYMVPPGLAFISVSKKAWKHNETAKCPRYYFDLKKYVKFHEKGETPTTTPVSLVYALSVALKMLEAEGLENIWARHKKLATTMRKALKAMGLKLLADDSCASMSVTAILPPDGVKEEDIRKIMKKKHGVIVSGGQGDLAGKIFRIGHMGYVDHTDMIMALTALEMALNELKVAVPQGAGVKVIQDAFGGN
jgi:aspartate aminotransferase-like enzyme